MGMTSEGSPALGRQERCWFPQNAESSGARASASSFIQIILRRLQLGIIEYGEQLFRMAESCGGIPKAECVNQRMDE
jgi:hypothetical protein